MKTVISAINKGELLELCLQAHAPSTEPAGTHKLDTPQSPHLMGLKAEPCQVLLRMNQ